MNNIFDVRFIKFGMVGLFGMVIDFSITWFFKEKLRINKYIANSLGFSVAVINNFLLNRYWTFENTSTPVAGQLTKFALVSITGLLINNTLLYLLLKGNKRNFYFIKLVVIGLVFFWNYFLNLLFTFK